MSAGSTTAACALIVGCIGLLAVVIATQTDPVVAAAAPTATPSAKAGAVEARPPVAGKWELIWRDEFDGAALRPIWHAAQYWDKNHTVVGGGELQAYDRTGVSVSEGMLRLTARKQAKYGVQYVSGLVQTGGHNEDPRRPKFSFKFGYLEVRAKLPSGKGLWPAVWMMPASYNDRNGEIDVLEVIGSEPRVANFSLHRNGKKNTDTWTGPDFSSDFHTFGVHWQPDQVSWYVDGVERGRMADPDLICPEEMYPILNLAVGGDWPGAPDASTKFPATLHVDYVRVWQQAR